MWWTLVFLYLRHELTPPLWRNPAMSCVVARCWKSAWASSIFIFVISLCWTAQWGPCPCLLIAPVSLVSSLNPMGPRPRPLDWPSSTFPDLLGRVSCSFSPFSMSRPSEVAHHCPATIVKITGKVRPVGVRWVRRDKQEGEPSVRNKYKSAEIFIRYS